VGRRRRGDEGMERRGPARSNCGYDGAHGLAGAGAGAGDSSFMAPHLPTYSRSPGTMRPTPLSPSVHGCHASRSMSAFTPVVRS
jgi:hypothetical protein